MYAMRACLPHGRQRAGEGADSVRNIGSVIIRPLKRDLGLCEITEKGMSRMNCFSRPVAVHTRIRSSAPSTITHMCV